MPNQPQLAYSSGLLGLLVTLGHLAIWIGLTCAVTCVALYWTAMLRAMRQQGADASPEAAGKKSGTAALSPAEQKTEAIGLLARRFFYATSTCVVVGVVCLMGLVLNQMYPIHYVWKNSNGNLPFGYRFASFWADQEGTFFLWALYNVVIGSMLLWKARQDERWIMPFFGLIHVSLFTLLTFMDPFWMHPAEDLRKALVEQATRAGLTADHLGSLIAFLPEHPSFGQKVAYFFGWGQYINPTVMGGKGLNESLQNFWMVIHPPTLFVGFSTMVVPGCFALGALMKRDYDTWVNRCAPWLMFSWTILGIGVFMGAYWAYETLGWGGYWAWDPVENASIIPWLVGTTLMHGLLAQRVRGNFKQANLFIGLMAGWTVLLASFLNRSGVLSEASVHSFASPQDGVRYTLLAMMVLWFVMAVGVWLWRFKEIQSEIAYENIWERHFGFFMGLIVLAASALVVIFGTTAPIWMAKVNGKSAIEHTFYNKTMLPIAYVMVLLMALTPQMPWRRAREGVSELKLFNKVTLGLSAVITIFFVFAAVWAWMGRFVTQNDPAYLAFGMILAVALVCNFVSLFRSARAGIMQTGAWLAHIGFVVLLGGVVISTRYKQVVPVDALRKGESVQVAGLNFTFKGGRKAAGPTDRDRLLVDVSDGKGRTWALDPKVFINRSDPENPMAMAWPQTVNLWWEKHFGDIYVEPSGTVGYAGIGHLEGVPIGGTEPKTAVVQLKADSPKDTVSLRLIDWKLPKDAPKDAPPAMRATVELSINGGAPQRIVAPLGVGEEGLVPVPVPVSGFRQGSDYSLVFQSVDPKTRSADFALIPAEPIEMGSFQVLYIPAIHVVWFGCYIMFAGGLISYLRRAQLARRTQPVPGTVRRARVSGAAEPSRSPEPVGAE